MNPAILHRQPIECQLHFLRVYFHAFAALRFITITVLRVYFFLSFANRTFDFRITKHY